MKTNPKVNLECKQRFDFCGKLDCPDWILAQLFHASKLDLPRFRLICEKVKDTILADGAFDPDLMNQLELDDEHFDIDDARACFAAVNYIITNASLYRVATKILSSELLQLGLPSEHCQLLCEVMEENLDEIRRHL